MELVSGFLFLNLGIRADYFNISKNFTVDPGQGLKWCLGSYPETGGGCTVSRFQGVL